MKKSILKLFCGASVALLAASAHADQDDARYRHVLLISIDGMHNVDLQNYIASHPSSTLAALAAHGVNYTDVTSSAPSDSFPGLLALVTGGTPTSTGVWYDFSYDRSSWGPGTNCQGPSGFAVLLDSTLDYDLSVVTGGGTIGDVHSQINPANLPLRMEKGVCTAYYPHSFLKVNTIFEVIKAHGLRTAWADKHPAYDLVNGPSGVGVDDLYTPEVDSNDPMTGQITTNGYHSIQRNDQYKVTAVLNEIKGLNSTGVLLTGMPAVLGMNFQSVSVGEKLKNDITNDPADVGLIGGYADALGAMPNNGLATNLDYVDSQIGLMVTALQTNGHANDTLVIITAKHGQSPIDVTTRVGASDALYGGTPGMGTLGSFTTDDVGLVWLDPTLEKSQYKAAESYLLANAAALHIDTLVDKTGMSSLGFKNPFGDNRTPDFIAITHPGVIYTGGTKIAEHGGFAYNDHAVALLVSNPHIAPVTTGRPVFTRQVAPTILKALGIDPEQLDAVRKEGTRSLPSLGF
jgi:hypothetical protein